MIQYLIQVLAFQLLFLLAYDLFLKKETFFNWNRVYLIFSSLISFVLPFIKIESFQNAVPQEYIVLLPEIVLTPEKTVEVIAPSWNWYVIIGIVVSSSLFIYKITQLIQLKLKGIIVHKGDHKIIKIPNSSVAFSIFNYVFIGNNISEEKLQNILSHELVHVREKHSIDLLYFELLRILCWFNPLVYIYQKRISEVHEYIADASVAKENNKSDYYEKLLAEVFQTQHFSFTNQFFKHSLIKKRIIMLTKQKSRQILKLKYLVLVPVLILSLFYTSNATNIADIEYTIESVDPGDKDAKLKSLYKRLNELNQNLKDDEYFTRMQYDEVVKLMTEISKLVDKDGEFAKEYKLQSYEDYLNIRKKRIAEGGNYSELQSDPIEFKVIDKAPVFPGCESSGTLEELKDCFILSIQKHVNKNFDMKMAGKLELGEEVQKIYAKFIIDKNGAVTDMNVRAPHPDLETEVERILLMLPKLAPGEKDGKPVSIKYLLPIAFKIH
ncbi:M56 family metallopeptidase [uncultured Kordia sp.]|uniref:M56 family metallopeptidase n=1 Tax=uncultured Kordia sp. TaxID=507699 RepID=UPI00261DF9DB|nr:M56 family metallopeptidase [uncultured Kordia sp.]